MKLDIKKAFLSPFSDKDWFWKISLFGYLSLIIEIISMQVDFKHINKINLSLWIFVAFPIAFVIMGYFIRFIHNEINDIKPLIPEWRLNLKKYFKTGLAILTAITSYLVPFLIIYRF